MPDVPAMMWGGGGGATVRTPSSAPPTPRRTSLREYADSCVGLELATLLRWRERRDDFPEPVAEGERGTKLYAPADLDLFVSQRVS